MGSDSDIQRIIADVFGLRAFTAGRQASIDDNWQEMPAIFVDAIWVARVRRYKQPVVISVLHIAENTRGVFFIEHPLMKNIHAVNLVNWSDPVVESLKDINLITTKDHMRFGNGYAYDLYIETPSCAVKIFVPTAPTEEPKLDRLGEAIISSGVHIAQLYNKREINRLLRTSQWDK